MIVIPYSETPAPKPTTDDLSDLLLTETPGPILIRATNGKSRVTKDRKKADGRKLKIATVVEPDALDAFYIRYAEAWKTGMSALKKRDRKGKKKQKKKKAKTESGAAPV